jgi:hypothetical protein
LDSSFNVFRRRWKPILRSQTVIDAEPSEFRICERLEEIGDVFLFVTGDPSSSMDENGCRKWPCSVGNVCVQRKRFARDISEWNIPQIFCLCCSDTKQQESR